MADARGDAGDARAGRPVVSVSRRRTRHPDLRDLAEHVSPSRTVDTPHFPSRLIGGGYPILTDVQGQMHVGSLGCLVTDGDSTYALTNAHVTGEEGREVYTLVRGERRRVGLSAQSPDRTFALGSAYRGWSATGSQLNVDAGLIRLDELSTCTAQVFGIGVVGLLIDLNVNTISLDVIGCPVTAFGGASGELHGQIEALFYRYRSVGGIDYIADMLIGPRPKSDYCSRVQATRAPCGSSTTRHQDGTSALGPAKPQAAGPAMGRRRARRAGWRDDALRAGDLPEHGVPDARCRARHRLQHRPIGLLGTGRPLQDRRDRVRSRRQRQAPDAADHEPRSHRLRRRRHRQRRGAEEFRPRRIRAPGRRPGPEVEAPRRRVRAAEGRAHALRRHGSGRVRQVHREDAPRPVQSGHQRRREACGTSSTRSSRRTRRPTCSADRCPSASGRSTTRWSGSSRAQKLVDFVCAAGILAHYIGDACQPLHTSQLFDGPPGAHNGVHSRSRRRCSTASRPDRGRGERGGREGKGERLAPWWLRGRAVGHRARPARPRRFSRPNGSTTSSMTFKGRDRVEPVVR